MKPFTVLLIALCLVGCSTPSYRTLAEKCDRQGGIIYTDVKSGKQKCVFL